MGFKNTCYCQSSDLKQIYFPSWLVDSSDTSNTQYQKAQSRLMMTQLKLYLKQQQWHAFVTKTK